MLGVQVNLKKDYLPGKYRLKSDTGSVFFQAVSGISYNIGFFIFFLSITVQPVLH
jgi:hypothetical protein